MKVNSIDKLTITRWLTLALSGLLSVQAARANDSQTYGDLIAQARSQVTSNDFLAALQIALRAILEDNADYRGHYYAALALYEQDMFDQAAQAAQKAWDRAPADQKEAVHKLVDAIAGQRAYNQTLQQANEAEEAGLWNKAATLYTEAWQANTNDQATALKAAHLWAEKLNNAQEAARILHAVLANPRDDAITADASQLLLTLQPQLQVAFHQSMDNGRRFLMARNYPEAAKAIESAVEFFPDEIDPHIYLARARAGLNDFDGMKSELLAAARTGMTNSDPILSRAEFYAQLSNPTFVTLMQDVFGSGEGVRIQATQQLWATYSQNVSDYWRAKEAFDPVAKNLNSYETSNLASATRDLQQTGELLFNGQLSAAAEIVAGAARLYNDAARQGKINGLQNQLGSLKAQIDNLQESIENEEEEFKKWGQNFNSTPEGQVILMQMHNMAATPGNFQAALAWGKGENDKAIARKGDAVHSRIVEFQRQKEMAEENISSIQAQLQHIGGDDN